MRESLHQSGAIALTRRRSVSITRFVISEGTDSIPEIVSPPRVGAIVKRLGNRPLVLIGMMGACNSSIG